MGNCIIRQNKIMQTGQEVMAHKESMKVHQVLEVGTKGGDRVVRIKLVITKQELQVMLRKGGVSASDLASHMIKSSDDAVVIEDEDNTSCGRWKPVLDSISESN